MIRQLSTVFLVLILHLPLGGPAWGKYASIVVDYHSGRVIHAVNPDTRNYPASLTKIMTLFMTFEALRDGKLKPNQKLPVSSTAQGRSPSKLGLRKGGTIRVRDCVYALITKSANDAATVLAEAMGGTERKFARMMTRRARELGMRNTTFRNASGLPHRGQLSTARDMSVLARALLRTFPEQYRKFSRRSWKWRGRTYHNHNRLLSWYSGADGIKTGYIQSSGFNLVASAERNGRRFIAIVFGGKTSRSRDRMVARLLDKGFATTVARAAVGTEQDRSPVRKVRPARSPGPVQKSRSVSGTDNWAIQVGVYYSYSRARRAIRGATRSVPDLSDKPHDIVTQKSQSRRHSKMYKARLLLDSRASARDSCRALERQRINCLVVRYKATPTTATVADTGKKTPATRSASTTRQAKRVNTPTGKIRSWAIQVGVYYSYSRARRAIRGAIRSVPDLSDKPHDIVTRKSQSRRHSKMYKARLLLDSRASARNSCRALERQRINCMVVRYNAKPTTATVADTGKKNPATRSASTSRQAKPVKTPAGKISSWAIQVGVYYSYTRARRAIRGAIRSVPDLSDKPHDIVTQKSQSRRHSKMYKARLLLDSRASARDSCRALEQQRINCMVVRYNAKPTTATVADTGKKNPATRSASTSRQAKPVNTPASMPARAPAGKVKSWAIQVGVYYAYSDAKRAIMLATRSVPRLKQERYKITTKKSKNRKFNKMYKARLLVESRSSARDYCRALENRKINCLVVRMG